jgi:branched-chain amino acid transport system substrate-binding protein
MKSIGDARRWQSAGSKCGLLILLLAAAGLMSPAATRDLPDTSALPQDSIRIGLILSGSGDSGFALARQAAVLAVEEANGLDGYEGRPFQLLVRTNDGPWGSGAKKVTELVFDQNVVALVGSMDGRGAHLAEQIATKGRIAFVSSWASDPTITQAYVPWVFRCIPDDRQQAHTLAKEISEKRKLTRVVTIRDASYDDRQAEEAFARIAFEHGDSSLTRLVDRNVAGRSSSAIRGADAEAAVLFVTPKRATALVQTLTTSERIHSLFVTLKAADALSAEGVIPAEAEVFAISPGHWDSDRGSDFTDRFAHRWNQRPDTRSAYVYDAVALVLAAIAKVGPDRALVRKTLSSLEHTGATGLIRFDDLGNRIGLPGVVQLGRQPTD